MKVIAISFAVGVAGTNQNFATGQALGAALSEGISGGGASFQAEMANVFASQPAVRNVAVEKVMASKASFLQKRPTLNLHVGETKSSSLAADVAALRAASFLESPSDVQRLAAEASAGKDAINYYGSEIALGGESARAGLVGALGSSFEPNMKASLTGLISKAARLAKMESTPDSIRNLCGSLITYLTSMPVAFTSTDTEGGNAHVNIIVPAPSRIYGPSTGDLYA